MADLAAATAADDLGDGRFAATLSPDWEVWGPQGGYLASVALRAGGTATGRTRPASITAHFLATARSETVEIVTRVNRSTRVATSVSVDVRQDDRTVLTALVWGVDDGLPGLEHHQPRSVPTLGDPAVLPTNAERHARSGDAPPPHPFWQHVEERRKHWIDDWANRPALPPTNDAWFRFRPAATFDDPWIDACRSLVLLDLCAWGAASAPHTGVVEHYAPTIDVTARFVGDARANEFLWSEAAAPIATEGLVAATGAIWVTGADGSPRLMATGGSTLLCRPAARRPDAR